MNSNEDIIKIAEEYRDLAMETHGVTAAKAVELGWLHLISMQLQNIEELLKGKSGNPGWDHSRTINISAPDLSNLTAEQVAGIERLMTNLTE